MTPAATVVDLSVVIPTRDRSASLRKLLLALERQHLPDGSWEVVVVDDGSRTPVTVPDVIGEAKCRLVRLNGVERSAARNAGVRAAVGRFVVFLDDDMRVDDGFLAAHLAVCRMYRDGLVVGTQLLPEDVLSRPFPRFRAGLEQAGVPDRGGSVSIPNFCTAANMSIARETFLALGGFDEHLTEAEDQDLALRHSARGGTIVFAPEARGIHEDGVLDIRRYCRRVERTGTGLVAFCRRHPAWPDNIARERKYGPIRVGGERLRVTVAKLATRAGGFSPITTALVWLTVAVEHVAPRSRTLQRLYRWLIGIHLYRGYREGMARPRTPPGPTPGGVKAHG